jgi:hypothetical protein
MAALKDTPPHEFKKPPTETESIVQSLLGGGSAVPAEAAQPAAPETAPHAHAPGDPVLYPGGYYKTNQ